MTTVKKEKRVAMSEDNGDRDIQLPKRAAKYITRKLEQ